MKEVLRTVKYTVKVDEKFEKIALKLGRSKRLLFSQMIDYFYRSKKDPIDLNDELLRHTILKGQKDYIGFIKTQESELLIPIKREVVLTSGILKKILGLFNNLIIKHNDNVLENQLVQIKKLSIIADFLRDVQQQMDTKLVLKRKFEAILNTYIKERDRLGLISSAKDKEELVNEARRQVQIL